MADIGYLDDDGSLHLVGRAEDFINTSGRKVPCAQVERAVEQHSDVQEAAAFALPDAMLGEEVAVVVTATKGTNAEDVRRVAGAHLPGHAVPAHVFVLDELPRTRNGKIRKELLPTLLPRPQEHAAGSQTVEERLARIVSRILGVPDVDHTRTLLDLGAASSTCCASTSPSSKNSLRTSTSTCSSSETP